MKGKFIKIHHHVVLEVIGDFVEKNGMMLIACRDKTNTFHMVNCDDITHVFDNETEAKGRIS